MAITLQVEYIRTIGGNKGVITRNETPFGDMLALSREISMTKEELTPVEGDLIKVTRVETLGNVTSRTVTRQEKYLKGKWVLYDERDGPSKFIRALNNKKGR